MQNTTEQPIPLLTAAQEKIISIFKFTENSYPWESVLGLVLLTSLLTWTVGLSAPSVSLPTTPGCIMCLAHWKKGMTSRRALTGSRGGLYESCKVQ